MTTSTPSELERATAAVVARPRTLATRRDSCSLARRAGAFGLRSTDTVRSRVGARREEPKHLRLGDAQREIDESNLNKVKRVRAAASVGVAGSSGDHAAKLGADAF
eukprot:Amastigsp_a351886_6.p3 type:complete len:106 gc:universal Amastigsp_a351886_6:405-722(+)